MTATADRKISLDKQAEYARRRAEQQLRYYFGWAIPQLDKNGEADQNISELTDALLEAAALRMLLKLQTRE